MTFYQARAISKTGLHVRRSSWPEDQWFMIWRGTWFRFASGNPPHPVRATDYSKNDLLATDWTTMPAALAACPVDPATGSTGGTSAKPGTHGFPDDPTLPVVSVVGSGIPSGPDDPDVLPPPDPGTSGITVTFDSITQDPAVIGSGPGQSKNVMVNRTVMLPAEGGSTTFVSGYVPTMDGDPAPDSILWVVTVTRTGSVWAITLAGGFYSGGFKGNPDQPAGHAADNFYIMGGGFAFYGGTATVGAG